MTPLGTPELLDDLTTAGRPDRAGDWDIRAHLAGLESNAANEAALVDLDNGVTSLWVEVSADTDLAALLDGVLLDLAPVVLDAAHDQVGAARALLEVLGDTTPAEGTNLGGRGESTGRGRPAGPRRRNPRCRRRRDVGARPGGLRRAGAGLVARHRGVVPA